MFPPSGTLLVGAVFLAGPSIGLDKKGCGLLGSSLFWTCCVGGFARPDVVEVGLDMVFFKVSGLLTLLLPSPIPPTLLFPLLVLVLDPLPLPCC